MGLFDGMFSGLGSGIISGIGGFLQREDNKEAAKEAMAFSERMSSTAYQRGMADMRAAGLNPILAYKNGPASSPSGTLAATTDFLTPAVHSAQAAGRLANETETAAVSRDQMRASTEKLKADEELSKASTANTLADTANKVLSNDVLRGEAEKGRSLEDFRKSSWGKIMRFIGNSLSESGISGSATPNLDQVTGKRKMMGNITVRPMGGN